MFRALSLILLSLMPTLLAAVQTFPEKKLETELLPCLNIPRAGHATLIVGGRLTVIGGHTLGFVPTATAEYYADGEWHLMSTVYTHDQGLYVPLSDSRVLIGGGHEQNLGIGQQFSVEMYHPDSYTFEGYGCLDQKRCFANGIELDSGQVIISGNWYAVDAIEVYKGERLFSPLRTVSQMRSKPYMLRTAKDNAIIFSATDEHDNLIDNIIVDRVKGEPFTPPLFNTWRPRRLDFPPRCDDGRIGNYAYLFTVEDSTGQMAIARTQGEAIDLLPTSCPVPMKYHGQHINYFTPVIADRKAGRAYITGFTSDHILCVLCIEYKHSPAQLTLYCTELQDSLGLNIPVLNTDGHLIMAGGTIESNFAPLSSVLLLKVGNRAETATTGKSSHSFWLWIITGGVTLLLIAIVLAYKTRKKSETAHPTVQSTTKENNEVKPDNLTAASSKELMQRINQLMLAEQLFLLPELKIQDIAQRLNTNRTYISDTIRAVEGCSFIQYINTLRVDYAKQLLQQHPYMKILEVTTRSGFSTDTSFFRTFKAITGMSPKEWAAKFTEK